MSRRGRGPRAPQAWAPPESTRSRRPGTSWTRSSTSTGTFAGGGPVWGPGGPRDDIIPIPPGRHLAILSDHSTVIRVLDLESMSMGPARNLPGGHALASPGNAAVFLLYPFSNLIQKLSVPDLRPMCCTIAPDWGHPLSLTTGLPSDGGGPLAILAQRDGKCAILRVDADLTKSSLTLNPAGLLVTTNPGSSKFPRPRSPASEDGKFFAIANTVVEHAEPNLYKPRDMPLSGQSWNQHVGVSPDGRFCFNGNKVNDLRSGNAFGAASSPYEGYIPDQAGRFLLAVLPPPQGKSERSLKVLDTQAFAEFASLDRITDWDPPPNSSRFSYRYNDTIYFDSKRGLLIDVPYSGSSLRVRRLRLTGP